MKRITFSILLLSIILVSCSDDGPRGVVFKKADYGAKWPFSVDQIDVFCAGLAKNEIYFQSGDKVYALNGKAQTAAENRKSAETFDSFKEVWLDDPQYPGSKMPVPSEFIDKAFAECGQ
jgi:hypothetical protein